MHQSENSVLDSNKQYYRVSCVNCRSNHRKCDRILPSCTRCINRGETCCYIPPKNRGRPTSSNSDDDTTVALSQSTQYNSNHPVNANENTTVLSNNNNTAIAINLEIQPRFIVSNPIVISKPMTVTLEEYANHAEWYATRALFVLQARAVKGQPQVVRSICEQATKQLSKVAPNTSVNELYDLIQRSSRSTLQQNALEMFHKAKEIVLKPNVYPNIATNGLLANACSTLATFLVLKQNITESKLFAGAVGVFIKQLKATDSISAIDSIDTEDVTKIVEHKGVSVRFYYLKLMFFFFSDTTKYTMDGLVKVLQALQNIAKLEAIFSEGKQKSHQLLYDTWTKLIQIMNNYTGLQDAKLLLNTLELLATELIEVNYNEYMIALVRGIQTCLINIACKNTTAINDQLELKALQVKYITIGIKIVAENNIIAEYYRDSTYFILSCELILEYCDMFVQPDYRNGKDTLKVSELLTCLQSMAVIIRKFQSDSHSMYDVLSQKLNTRILLLLKYMHEEPIVNVSTSDSITINNRIEILESEDQFSVEEFFSDSM
jgi:hypothetical protein